MRANKFIIQTVVNKRRMNNDRIFCVTNIFLLLGGYQVHWFECKKHRFRMSVWAVIYISILALLYAICFNQHFEPSSLLQMLKDVSPFLQRMVRMQLLIGLKTFLVVIYELKFVTKAANELIATLPQSYVSSKFCRNEAFAYFLLFSTILICLGVGLYIAIEMEFKLPLLEHIFIGTALFLPHFILSGALKFFNIGALLIREELQRLALHFNKIVMEDVAKASTDDKIELSSREANNHTENHFNKVETLLLQNYTQLECLTNTQKVFHTALEKQLLLLVVLNNNCLLTAVYSLVYFEYTWHLIFFDRTKRIFYAAVYGIFVFILWDYMCFLWTQTSFENVKLSFYKSVCQQLKPRRMFSKVTRSTLKDIRDLLSGETNFKLTGAWYMNPSNFVLLQVFVALVIALIVIYQFLNDKIFALAARLDENDETD